MTFHKKYIHTLKKYSRKFHIFEINKREREKTSDLLTLKTCDYGSKKLRFIN